VTDERSLQITHPAPGVLALLMDAPASRNALDEALVEALIDGVQQRPARALILGSTDSRCFCAGAHLGLPDARRAALSIRMYELYRLIVQLPIPVLAVLQGPAVGGGAQLAVAADMRIGDRSASLRFVGPGHGLAVGAWALPSLIGRGRSLDLCLSMRTVDADEALRIGLLDRLSNDPRSEAVELAGSWARLDADAVARVKRVAHRSSDLLEALEAEDAGNRGWSGSMEGQTGAEIVR
jgi:enoyl-CoA hydratase/carnithine racemase